MRVGPAWSLPVRITHWLVALGVLVNLWNETGRQHRWIGYAVLFLVLVRIVYGNWFSSAPSSRFYWPRTHQIKQHLFNLVQRREEDLQGHNPLGQLAVYVMWVLIALLAFTGWLSRIDRYWGEDWVVDIHIALSDMLLMMIVLHILVVVTVSWWQNTHLIKRMITGKNC